jgi:hypothetical protein
MSPQPVWTPPESNDMMEASSDEFFDSDFDDEASVAKKAYVATVRSVNAATRARASLGPERRRDAAAHGGGGHGQLPPPPPPP